MLIDRELIRASIDVFNGGAMSVVRLWERFFLKKRNVMAYHSAISSFSNVQLVLLTDLEVEPYLKQGDTQFGKRLLMRKGSPEWILFYYAMGNRILGYSFLHVPFYEQWNDSLPTLSREARVSSNFVYPEYRGRGILSEIAKCQIKYAEENGLRLWCVIEENNISAMRATSKHASICRVNYLLKIAGINVLSILTNPFRVYLLSGQRRARR